MDFPFADQNGGNATRKGTRANSRAASTTARPGMFGMEIPTVADTAIPSLLRKHSMQLPDIYELKDGDEIDQISSEKGVILRRTETFQTGPVAERRDSVDSPQVSGNPASETARKFFGLMQQQEGSEGNAGEGLLTFFWRMLRLETNQKRVEYRSEDDSNLSLANACLFGELFHQKNEEGIWKRRAIRVDKANRMLTISNCDTGDVKMVVSLYVGFEIRIFRRVRQNISVRGSRSPAANDPGKERVVKSQMKEGGASTTVASPAEVGRGGGGADQSKVLVKDRENSGIRASIEANSAIFPDDDGPVQWDELRQLSEATAAAALNGANSSSSGGGGDGDGGDGKEADAVMPASIEIEKDGATILLKKRKEGYVRGRTKSAPARSVKEEDPLHASEMQVKEWIVCEPLVEDEFLVYCLQLEHLEGAAKNNLKREQMVPENDRKGAQADTAPSEDDVPVDIDDHKYFHGMSR